MSWNVKTICAACYMSQIKTSESLTYSDDEVWCAQSEVELCGQNLFGLIGSALVHQMVHVLLVLQSPTNRLSWRETSEHAINDNEKKNL